MVLGRNLGNTLCKSIAAKQHSVNPILLRINSTDSNLSNTVTISKTQGIGLNLRVGAIYRTTRIFPNRAGLHSPSFFMMTDTWDTI